MGQCGEGLSQGGTGEEEVCLVCSVWMLEAQLLLMTKDVTKAPIPL